MKSKFICSILLLVSSFTVNASIVESPKYIVENLSLEQRYLMQQAYQVGKAVGLPETLQAVLLQETLAGKHGRVNWGDKKVAFGVAQVKPATAREMLEKYHKGIIPVDLSNLSGFHVDDVNLELEALRKRLQEDDMFALFVGALVLKHHQSRTVSWRQLVISYYAGVRGSLRIPKEARQNHFYYKGIAKKIQVAKLFNETVRAKPIRVAAVNTKLWGTQ